MEMLTFFYIFLFIVLSCTQLILWENCISLVVITSLMCFMYLFGDSSSSIFFGGAYSFKTSGNDLAITGIAAHVTFIILYFLLYLDEKSEVKKIKSIKQVEKSEKNRFELDSILRRRLKKLGILK